MDTTNKENKELTTRQRMLAERAKQDAARAPVTGDRWFRFRDKKFMLGDIGTSELRAVILDFTFENAYFPGSYSPNQRQAPTCWAVGVDGRTLAPGDKVANKQNAVCEGCWADFYDSASRGKGKACKNSVRAGVLVVGSDNSYFPAFLRIPPASLKNFSDFCDKTLRIAGMGLFEVIATVGFDKSATFEKLIFPAVTKIDDPELREAVAVHATDPALRTKLLKGFEAEVEIEAARAAEDQRHVAEIIGDDDGPGAAAPIDDDLPF